MAAQMKSVGSLMPLVGGAVGLWATAKVVPVMYHWDLIPGVGSPAYQAKAASIKYNHYREGIMYDSYDAGEMTTELPEYCKNKMLLRQKGGGWKLQSEM